MTRMHSGSGTGGAGVSFTTSGSGCACCAFSCADGAEQAPRAAASAMAARSATVRRVLVSLTSEAMGDMWTAFFLACVSSRSPP